MFAALRSFLAEIAPSLVRGDPQAKASNDNRNLKRDTLSAKLDPAPFGKRGLKPPARPNIPASKRVKRRITR